ncbi:hypothetical protein BC940DRAFT_311523 [Gongronella butleri]|nr:hypothetical protein BC940DRAFT_311523 [Gongronella butleri]
MASGSGVVKRRGNNDDGSSMQRARLEPLRPILSRSFSDPRDALGRASDVSGRQAGHQHSQRHWVNWHKVKKLARGTFSHNEFGARYLHRHRRRKLRKKKKNEQKSRLHEQDEDAAGLALMRAAEYNLLPSMLLRERFLGDDKGQRCIPVLLSLVRVRVRKVPKAYRHGHSNLAITISYGSAQWTVFRRYWDFFKLHYAYRSKDLPFAQHAGIVMPPLPNALTHRVHHPNLHRRHHRHGHASPPILVETSQVGALVHNDTASDDIVVRRSMHEEDDDLDYDEDEAIAAAAAAARVHAQLPEHDAYNCTNIMLHANASMATTNASSSNSSSSSTSGGSPSTGFYDHENPSAHPTTADTSHVDDSIDDDTSRAPTTATRPAILTTVDENHPLEPQQGPLETSENGKGGEIEKTQSAQAVPENDPENEEAMDVSLQRYLHQLITAVKASGKINRICKFLEISTLGVHLDALMPQAYHGKEGYLIMAARSIRIPKYRRYTTLTAACVPCTQGQHTRSRAPKWFMVRDNCLICLDHPSHMDMFDVFLFDCDFRVQRGFSHILTDKPKQLQRVIRSAASTFSLGHSTLVIETAQGELYLHAKNVEQAILFEKSITHALQHSSWCQTGHRFDSFSPSRDNSPCTWFVDGQDYFAEMAVALDNAQHYIYIHDWWLSPELYLRRPPSDNQEWRLDRVLKRKADQGVKIYVIVYKEVAMALPLFSHYTKTSLLSLSENIFVQRHPSRALDVLHKDNALFWAHHEKLCIVDGVVAFIGGLDLCFGRWDTPSHDLMDDPPLGAAQQTWPGKDYSNPRVEDFHTLDKPFEDCLDRSRYPRMPWHDVSMRVAGRAVQDLDRHFVERWNYLRRRKASAPKRDTPLLLPQTRPPLGAGANSSSLKDHFANDPRFSQPPTSTGTRVQILRSVSAWSIGNDRVEHSIMNAYVDLIEKSNHFVYIENQFFVTSTKVGSTVIENKIGDALFRRIVRAHENREQWHAMIVLPLLPGFPGSLDINDGTTVRLITHCQYASIGRGPDSLLARLHAAGVANTSQYITFYGLRHWGDLHGHYVSEQIYIHAKTMIVDDRTVIIGSANINERSMLGVRDSEIAACIEDTDLMASTMGGQSVEVGRFAHSLRLRLMAEHLGLPILHWNVDTLLANRSTFSPSPPVSASSSRHSQKSSTPPSQKQDNSNSTPIITTTPAATPISNDSNASNASKSKISPDTHLSPDDARAALPPAPLAAPSSSPSSSSASAIVTNTRRSSSSQPVQIGMDPTLPPPPATSSSSLRDHQRKASSQFSLPSFEQHHDEDFNTMYRKWASWDTDTNNNGDEQSLVPLPLPMTLDNNNKTVVLHAEEPLSPPPMAASSAGTSPFSPSMPPLPPQEANNATDTNANDLQEGQESQESQEGEGTPTIDVASIAWFGCLVDPLLSRRLVVECARRNTDLFRRCFMVVPDNNVRSWDAHDAFTKLARQLLGKIEVATGTAILDAHPHVQTAASITINHTNALPTSSSTSVHHFAGEAASLPGPRTSIASAPAVAAARRASMASEPSTTRTSTSTIHAQVASTMTMHPGIIHAMAPPLDTTSLHSLGPEATPTAATAAAARATSKTQFVKPFLPMLLERIRGHLVIWPIHFLEEENDEFLFAIDRLAPLEIFN